MLFERLSMWILHMMMLAPSIDWRVWKKEGGERGREFGYFLHNFAISGLVCLSLSLARQPNDEKFLFTHERTDGTGERRRNTTWAVVKIRQETERESKERDGPFCRGRLSGGEVFRWVKTIRTWQSLWIDFWKDLICTHTGGCMVSRNNKGD